MKSFVVSICLSLVLIGSAYSAQKRYFICNSCRVIYFGESLPKPEKCVCKNYQDIHDWKEMEMCYAEH